MASGFLNIAHNFAGETDFIIVEWVKSTAQGTPVIGHVTGTNLGAQNDTDVTEVFYPAPHTAETLQVINLPEVWHLVRFWRSSDGVTKDLLLLSLAGNARTGALYPITRYEYVVDRGYNNTTPVVTDGVWSDPVDTDTGLRDTRLAGQTYWIEERGTGSLIAAEYTDRTDDGGGFDFTDAFKVMNSGAVYVVYVITRIDAEGDDSGAVTGVSELDVFILNTDQDYNPLTMNGKTLIADFATTVGTLTIPNLLLVADSWFRLQTHGGSQRNVIIQLDAGDTVRFMGEDANEIILGENEEIMILVKDNVMYVLHHMTNHERLGQMIWSYKTLPNTLPGNGTQLALADYPRVEQLLDSLPSSSVVGSTTWNTSTTAADGQTVFPNKGKWMREGANFRPPLLTDKAIKGLSDLSGAVASGRYEHQEIMLHDHDLRGSFSYGGYDGGGNSFFRIRNLTDGFDTASKVVSDAGGSNNIVNNIGLYPLLCI